jgi:transposase InsO family protein
MREQELVAQRPRHRTVTTKSEPGAQVAPNLLQRDFSADEPDTKWVADTTYIWTAKGWLYLAVVFDLFSRMVVGWSMTVIEDATLVVQTLQMALARRRPLAGLLLEGILVLTLRWLKVSEHRCSGTLLTRKTSYADDW